MKTTRKFLAGILTSAAVLGLSFGTVFADEPTTPGNITLNHPENDASYKAYKIFDATQEDNNFTYTINKSTNPWFHVIFEGKEVEGEMIYSSKIDGLEISKVTGEDDIYQVAIKNGFDTTGFAEKFAILLTNGLYPNGKGQAVAPDFTNSGILSDSQASATTVKWTNLELGYYLIDTGKSGSVCALTTTKPDATVYDKWTIEFGKTQMGPDNNDKIDTTGVQVGDVINYTLKSKVPSVEGYTDYIYKVSDKMSVGLTFNKDVVVKIGQEDSAVTLTTDAYTNYYTLDYENTNSDFLLDIDIKQLIDASIIQPGQPIVITYTATVNENALVAIKNPGESEENMDVTVNQARLEFSNDPTDYTKTDTRTDEEKTFSCVLEVKKYKNGTNPEQPLNGAKFVLFKTDNDKVDVPNKTYYVYNDEKDKVSWDEDLRKATVRTSGEETEGYLYFKGLMNGIYFLEETEAPSEYNKLQNPVQVEINGAISTTDTTKVENWKQLSKVGNTKGTQLPETGGMGTTLFYIAGGVLVLGAGVILVAKKRSESNL